MRADKEMAAKAGVPKWLRQYVKRYGTKAGLEGMLQMRVQLKEVETLDHWADPNRRHASARSYPLRRAVLQPCDVVQHPREMGMEASG